LADVRRDPGRAWRWPAESALERGIASLRLLVAIADGAALALLPLPPAARPALAWGLAAAFAAYSLAMLATAERKANSAPLLDALYVLAWILATGARQSPFAHLILLAAATVPPRLPPRAQAPSAAGLAAFALLTAAPPSGLDALYVLLCGLGAAAWSRRLDAMRRDGLRDSLTGSLGRDYALVQLESLIERQALPFAVALVDLDGLAAVNAAHGRRAGDAALRECAGRIRAVIRPSDVLARFAGDTFLVVFPEAGLADGVAAAERIRARVAGARFALRASVPPVPLSVSVGVTEARSGQGVDGLMREAEQRLAAAKAGRGEVAAGAG
jgi:diguanylate cyclase (GGDEF)-like protein